MSESADSSPETLTSTLKICRPGRLAGRRTSATTATLTWDEPYASCSLCPDAVGYEISGAIPDKLDVVRPPCELRLSPYSNRRVSVRAKAVGGNISEPSYFDFLKSPGTPTNLRATDLTENGLTLSWDAPPGNVPVFDYEISHRGGHIATVRGLTYQMSYTASLFRYDFEVRARSARSNLSDPALLDITPPDKPTGMHALNVSSRAALLLWAPATDNVGVASYEVLKNDEVTEITQTPTPAFLAAGLIPETQYRFAVRALDHSGNRSATSDPLTVKTPLLDPPANVRIEHVSNSVIELAWDRPEGAIGLLGYKAEADDHRGSTREIQGPVQRVRFSRLRSNSLYSVDIRCHDASQRYSEPVSLQIKTT